MTNICKECVWCKFEYEREWVKESYWCDHQKAQTIDIITGETHYTPCEEARSEEGFCGPRGIYWTERLR